MLSAPCNLCDSNDASPLLAGGDQLFRREEAFTIVRCKQCNLTYLNPRPSADKLGDYYPSEYQTFMSDYTQQLTGVAKQGLGMIMRRRTPSLSPGRVLDIGCSSGSYLAELHKLGWRVHGVEIDPVVAQQARRRLGPTILTGPAESVLSEFPDNYFDVVTLWHTLEHLLDPRQILVEIHRILKPDGRLMLEVPNFRSISRLMLRTYWATLDIPRHLFHFTPRTLSAMLAKAGFSTTKIRGVPAAISFTSSLQLIWNEWSNDANNMKISLNPVLLCLCFPVSWLLAQFRLSSAMTAEAIK